MTQDTVAQEEINKAAKKEKNKGLARLNKKGAWNKQGHEALECHNVTESLKDRYQAIENAKTPEEKIRLCLLEGFTAGQIAKRHNMSLGYVQGVILNDTEHLDEMAEQQAMMQDRQHQEMVA